jgi:hypothetical protein
MLSMKRISTIVTAALLALAWAGCNGSKPAATTEASSPTPTQTGEAAPAAPRKAVEVAVEALPEQVITTFLAALKAGDEATTAALLTTKAREETAKHEIAVAPQSAPGATYEVSPGKVLEDNPNGAHVSSVWTETYPDGSITYEIVWVLRRQTDGWRIAGMALELIPGQPLQFLNFEDPQDMMRKHEEALAVQQQSAATAAAETAQAPPAELAPQENVQR